VAWRAGTDAVPSTSWGGRSAEHLAPGTPLRSGHPCAGAFYWPGAGSPDPARTGGARPALHARSQRVLLGGHRPTPKVRGPCWRDRRSARRRRPGGMAGRRASRPGRRTPGRSLGRARRRPWSRRRRPTASVACRGGPGDPPARGGSPPDSRDGPVGPRVGAGTRPGRRTRHPSVGPGGSGRPPPGWRPHDPRGARPPAGTGGRAGSGGPLCPGAGRDPSAPRRSSADRPEREPRRAASLVPGGRGSGRGRTTRPRLGRGTRRVACSRRQTDRPCPRAHLVDSGTGRAGSGGAVSGSACMGIPRRRPLAPGARRRGLHHR